MAQLVVRKLEDALVARLRELAAKGGISVEEAHRRILREALFGSPDASSLKDHLLAIPKAENDELEELFVRQRDQPRQVNL